MKLFIILLLISTSAFSQEDCVPIEHNSMEEHVHKLLDWWGASDKKITEAPCKTKNVPDEAEINKYIAGKAKGKSSETVNGVKFKDESPVLIQAFKDFTTAKDGFGYAETPENQKKIQAEFKINPDCDKVMCAMEKIWGKDFSQKLMFLKLKHNYNSSELAFDNSDRFKPEELDDVIIGLEDLPSHLSPLGRKNQRLTHFKRGYTLKQYSGNVVANSVIMIFDSWDNDSRASRQYTIFHEMAHNVSDKLSNMDESPGWLRLSGWVKKGEDWTASSSACLVSDYGKTNPYEDFAESLSSFRYNGKDMKAKCPEKYEFIKKNVFKGIEYINTKTCSPIPTGKLEVVQKEITDQIVSSMGTETFSEDEVAATCKNTFTSFPVTDSELSGCSSRLHNARTSPEKISDILKKNGIENTSANRDLILNNITEHFQTNETLMSEVAKKSGAVTEKINQIAQKSFEAANPQGFSNKEMKANDWKWRSSLKACGQLIFQGKHDESIECQIKDMMKQDRDSQKWNIGNFPAYKAPEIFSPAAQNSLIEKREEVLYSHLAKQPVTAEAKVVQKKEFKDSMRYHLRTTESKISEMKDWKYLSSEDFCQQTYASGSSWTETYGTPKGQVVPELLNGCVKLQNKKSKRYQLKESDWSSMIDSL